MILKVTTVEHVIIVTYIATGTTTVKETEFISAGKAYEFCAGLLVNFFNKL